MTREELRVRISERVEYHRRISDERVAGALELVLQDLESFNGVGEKPPLPDRLIPLEAAAKRLDVSVRWLRENRPPYVVELSPRKLKVSEQRLNAWLMTI